MPFPFAAVSRTIEGTTDCCEQFAQGFNVFLIRMLRVADQLGYTEVHNVLKEHPLQVELTNEANVAQHTTAHTHTHTWRRMEKMNTAAGAAGAAHQVQHANESWMCRDVCRSSTLSSTHAPTEWKDEKE